MSWDILTRIDWGASPSDWYMAIGIVVPILMVGSLVAREYAISRRWRS